MSSVFDTIFATAARATHEHYFGVAATYKTAAGVEIALPNAPFLNQGEIEARSDSGRERIARAEIAVSLALVPAPAIGETVTAEGTVWTVVEIMEISGGVARLDIQTAAVSTRSGLEHRAWRRR